MGRQGYGGGNSETSLEEKDILNEDSRLAGVKRLSMHIKGQARDRGIQPVHTPFYQAQLRQDATEV
jgi:hypothetical protein